MSFLRLQPQDDDGMAGPTADTAAIVMSGSYREGGSTDAMGGASGDAAGNTVVVVVMLQSL